MDTDTMPCLQDIRAMGPQMTMTIEDQAPRPKVLLSRPPQTNDELWWVVKALFGVDIPRQQVCPDHCAPIDAFAEGYFGNESSIALW